MRLMIGSPRMPIQEKYGLKKNLEDIGVQSSLVKVVGKVFF